MHQGTQLCTALVAARRKDHGEPRARGGRDRDSRLGLNDQPMHCLPFRASALLVQNDQAEIVTMRDAK